LEQQKFNYLKFLGAFESNINMNVLLRDTFQLNKTRGKYIEFNDKVRKSSEKMKVADQGKLLSILFELGWDFHDIVSSDPALPKRLLEDWEGDKAVDEMNVVRSELFKKIIGFFEEKNV
jgi:DNA-binding transcriptional regulator PaaX